MVETFQKYGGNGLIVSWFLVAWFYLLLKEKKKQNRIIFVYMPACILLLFFNPLFYRIFVDITEDAIYFRFLWILPISVVIAYSVISLVNGLKGKKKIIFGVIASGIIMISGKLVYTNPLFERADNLYHVPWEVVEICDTIKVEGREVMAVFPREFLLYVRQYSPYVCMPYGREAFEDGDSFFWLMEQDVIDAEELALVSKEHGCHYVILNKAKMLIGSLEANDYIVIKEIGDYLLYRDNTMNFGLNIKEE